MIIFETQEAFENAVVELLKKRLDLNVMMFENYGTVKTTVNISDKVSGEEICCSSDYVEVVARD